MARKKKADRRPAFASHLPWCCACCQEAAQLECVVIGTVRRKAREAKAAREILARFEAIRDGRSYGGVGPGNLFD